MPYQMSQILKRKKVRKKVRRVEKLPLRGRHREQLGSAIARGEAARHEIRQPKKGVLHYQEKESIKREREGTEEEEEEEKRKDKEIGTGRGKRAGAAQKEAAEMIIYYSVAVWPMVISSSSSSSSIQWQWEASMRPLVMSIGICQILHISSFPFTFRGCPVGSSRSSSTRLTLSAVCNCHYS